MPVTHVELLNELGSDAEDAHDGVVRRRVGHAPLILGALLSAGVATFDRVGDGSIIIGTVLLGPFVTARFGTARQTAAVAMLATGIAAASFSWHDNGLDFGYFLRLGLVILGGSVATVAAQSRTRSEVAVDRLAILAALADVFNSTKAAADIAKAIADLLVPAIVDYMLCDVIVNGKVRRLVVKVDGENAQELERFVLERPALAIASRSGSAFAAVSRSGHLLDLTDEVLVSISLDDDDLRQLRRLDLRTTSTHPLCARDEVIGALTLGVRNSSGRTLTHDDLRFHEILAGRVALALDNAGLDSNLREAERQLGVALGQLDEAVVITDPDGGVTYANGAALSMLGVSDAVELATASPGYALKELEFVCADDGRTLDFNVMPWGNPRLADDFEPVVVQTAGDSDGRPRWYRIKAAPIVNEEEDKVEQVVTVFEDVTELKRDELSARVLARATSAFSSLEGPRAMLKQVAAAAVPDLAPGCAIVLIDRVGSTEVAAFACRDGGDEQRLREGLSLSGETLGECDHGFCVPMTAEGETIGVMSFIAPNDAWGWSESDRELGVELARRTAAALVNRRLIAEQATTNRALQRGLRPAELYQPPGWSTASFYRPAGARNEVGGDLYDCFQTPNGWMVVIGDVTGHGAQAARLTAVSRFALRAVAELTGDAVTAVSQLNRTLLLESELSLVTLAIVRLGDVEADGSAEVGILRCGHPAPVVLSGAGLRFVGESGPLVGALPSASWTVENIRLDEGGALVLYTDGVTDAVGATGRFGEAGLTSALAGVNGNAEQIVGTLGIALDQFSVGAQADDEAVVVVQRRTR